MIGPALGDLLSLPPVSGTPRSTTGPSTQDQHVYDLNIDSATSARDNDNCDGLPAAVAVVKSDGVSSDPTEEMVRFAIPTRQT